MLGYLSLDICPWIFVLGHYLSFKDQSYSSYTLSENCLFHQILDNVHGKHRIIFFVPNQGYCLLTVNVCVFCVIIHVHMLHVFAWQLSSTNVLQMLCKRGIFKDSWDTDHIAIHCHGLHVSSCVWNLF